MGSIIPFAVDVPDDDIDDLRARLGRARWSDSATDDWSWGTPPTALRALIDEWTNTYDWRGTERRFNEREQYLVEAGGTRIHVVRAGTPGAQPLMLVHGWPDGFLRFEKVLPLLADRFDIVIPSLPGYGFSDRPSQPGWGPVTVAGAFDEVMAAFGFDRYVAHGSDHGSAIVEALGALRPDRVVALHLGDVPAWRRYTIDPSAHGDAVRAYAETGATWFATEGAYAAEHRTKPQTIGFALGDSPLALASWMFEKLHGWADNDAPSGGLTMHDVLDDISLYWFTGTAASAIRYYRDSGDHLLPPSARATQPTGFTVFPHDTVVATRPYAELFFDVKHFALQPHGGHFGPWEQPELFARDLRTFTDAL